MQIITESEKTVWLTIALANGKGIDLATDKDLERVGNAAVLSALVSLKSIGAIEYTLSGSLLSARMLMEFGALDVDRGAAIIVRRQLGALTTEESQKLLWYLTPTDEHIEVSRYDFTYLRDMVSRNINSVSKELTALKYPDYLRTPFWKILSYRVKQEAFWKCAACNSDEDLNAHHREYPERGTEILNHKLFLTCFCESCHTIFHNAKKSSTHVLENTDH